MEFTINMILRNETPGALRFEEVDEKGKVIPIKDGAKIGTLYIRKTACAGQATPRMLLLKVVGK